jgi:hypothetical protein
VIADIAVIGEPLSVNEYGQRPSMVGHTKDQFFL